MSKRVIPYDDNDSEIKIDAKLAKRIVSLCDKGLCSGLGVAEPGRMCIEAAVNFAMGRPHGDQPTCVDDTLRDFKIDLNDSLNFASNRARGKALKRLGIAQLGTAEGDYEFDYRGFQKHVEVVLQKHIDKHIKGLVTARDAKTKTFVSQAISKIKQAGLDHLDSLFCILRDDLQEIEETFFNADGLAFDPETDVVDANYWDLSEQIEWIARDMPEKEKAAFLRNICEEFVKILIKMKTPGSKFLHLAPFRG